jgi:hypothetical protein
LAFVEDFIEVIEILISFMRFVVLLHFSPGIVVVVYENSHEQMVFVAIEILLNICNSRVLCQLEQLISQSWVDTLRGRRAFNIARDIIWIEVINITY